MSASSIPLKIQNANGDLQEFTPSDELYLSYAVGEALVAAASNDVGNISLTDGQSIGSFVDSYYNEISGTHPASQITGTSVTTTLKQVSGPADESGADFVRPVGYYDVDPNPGFYEMVDGDLDNLAGRVLSNLVQNDYIGTFKLSATQPSADYTKFIDSVFSDTHGNGGAGTVVTNYHIWMRTSMPSVAPVRPVATSYDGSGFNGLKEMSDAQIQYTLGQRIKTLRATSGAIGSYQLRSTAQGAPTVPGTWVSVGTAQNTRRTPVDVAYARTRVSSYNRARVSAYTRTRVSTYTRDSVDNFARTFVGDYTGTYSRDFTGNYTRNFEGNYSRTRPSSYSGTYARTRVSSYSRTRLTAFTGYFAGTYSRARVSVYTRNRVTPFTGTFSRTRTSSYTRGRVSSYAGTYSRNRVSSYAAAYVRTRVSSYSGTYASRCTS